MAFKGKIMQEKGMQICDREYLTQRYEEALSKQEQHALIHINVKNFRYYNTKYGKEGGNEILGLMFQRICSILDKGEYAAHLYADNFAVLVKCDDTHHLIYERLMQLIDKVYRIEDGRIYRNLFLSMGIYLITDRGVCFEEALNQANLCRKGSEHLNNRSTSIELYEESFRETYMDRLKLEEDTADAYKNYEFVTYLQPKVDLKTGEVAGAEALLRWFDEDGNSIPLYKFLPILNQNAYIQLVDLDSFEQMCQYLDARIKNNQEVVPISFNISKAYFYDPSMAEDYIQVFERYDIPKNLIEIELMESISLNDTKQMRKVINEFKEYGFTCVLDDFGNGYSSFNVLLNAQLDVVKMDRQFFMENLNGNGELVVKTVVDLIHSLNMKVVAEGVEIKEHVEFLQSIGCDYVQGFYFYKPMAVNEFDKVLERHRETKNRLN